MSHIIDTGDEEERMKSRDSQEVDLKGGVKGQVRESQIPENLASIYTLSLDNLLRVMPFTERIIA